MKNHLDSYGTPKTAEQRRRDLEAQKFAIVMLEVQPIFSKFDVGERRVEYVGTPDMIKEVGLYVQTLGYKVEPDLNKRNCIWISW